MPSVMQRSSRSGTLEPIDNRAAMMAIRFDGVCVCVGVASMVLVLIATRRAAATAAVCVVVVG